MTDYKYEHSKTFGLTIEDITEPVQRIRAAYQEFADHLSTYAYFKEGESCFFAIDFKQELSRAHAKQLRLRISNLMNQHSTEFIEEYLFNIKLGGKKRTFSLQIATFAGIELVHTHYFIRQII